MNFSRKSDRSLRRKEKSTDREKKLRKMKVYVVRPMRYGYRSSCAVAHIVPALSICRVEGSCKVFCGRALWYMRREGEIMLISVSVLHAVVINIAKSVGSTRDTSVTTKGR
jgi:hypothetical protein